MKIIALLLSFNLFATADDLSGRISKLHLELAEAFSQARIDNKVCDLDAYQSTIVEHVRKARHHSGVGYDQPFHVSPAILKGAGDSLMLKSIIMPIDEHKPDLSKMQQALAGVTMYGPHRGVFGNSSILQFKASGVVELSEIEILADDPWVKWHKSSGSYSIDKKANEKKIRVTLKVGGKNKTYFFLIPNNSLGKEWGLLPVDQPNGNPWLDGFTDYPSDCEA